MVGVRGVWVRGTGYGFVASCRLQQVGTGAGVVAALLPAPGRAGRALGAHEPSLPELVVLQWWLPLPVYLAVLHVA